MKTTFGDLKDGQEFTLRAKKGMRYLDANGIDRELSMGSATPVEIEPEPKRDAHEDFLVKYVLARAKIVPSGTAYGELARNAEVTWKLIQDYIKEPKP
jgi:hypothetical protein